MGFVYLNIMEEEKLKEIIKGCVEQNPNSQKELYTYFYNKMLGICFKYTQDPEVAKDTVQDGFIKIFKAIPTFKYDYIDNKVEAILYSWMRRIMYNISFDRLRKEKTRPTNVQTDYKFIDLLSNDDYKENEYNMLKDKQIEFALEAVNELAPMLKLVTSRLIFDGYTHQQVAKEFGISEGTSKSYFFRAKGRLRKIMEKKLKGL
jgi:RNA polymerase sigma-70 factor (ECF subfamily)